MTEPSAPGAVPAPGSVDTPRSAFRVRPYDEADRPSWDAYVAAHPRATFFHQIGWKNVLDSAFGYPAHYFVAERDGTMCGVLPLYACRSIKGKLALYSLPHTVYGGPVGDDAEVETALVETARNLGSELRTRLIELRNRHESLVDMPALEGFATFEKELPAEVEKVYKTFPKKAREAINQSRKRWHLEADFSGDVDSFYELLAASYHSLGTPVFPKRFFAALVENFPEHTSILNVLHEGKPVATVLSTLFRDTMMPLYSGEIAGAGRLKAGNFKYFRLMEHAVERGLRRYDFGRTRLNNEGVVKFKLNQGFDVTPLPYQAEGAENAGGVGGSDPNQGLFQKARRVWRKLPRSVARGVGPRLIRYFP